MEWLDAQLPSLKAIKRKLEHIFPREIDNRGFITRDIGVKTVFVMLYGFCFENMEWLRPVTVTFMTSKQASRTDAEIRKQWLSIMQGRKAPKDIKGRWYAQNTRESIRDETLREMVRLNAVKERDGLATTSSHPRYALNIEFAELFNPNLKKQEFEDLVKQWQTKNLSTGALARTAISKKYASSSSSGILITLPNGETRKMAPGPSTELIKATVEEFTKRFMKEPAVALISESANKLLTRDDELCNAIKIKIDVSTTLPDILIVELGRTRPLLVFIECVASDGPVNERRKEELLKIALNAGYTEDECVFVTVFKDRTASENRRLLHTISWGTFVWYLSEPDSIIFLYKGMERKLTYLCDIIDFLQCNDK